MKKRRSKLKSMSFQEKPFRYEYEEYQRWCMGDESTIQSLIDVCGDLGRTRETYFRQAKMKQNYPEVRYAVHLVEEEGFHANCIIYENYRLSLQELSKLNGKTGLIANGASLLSEIFLDAFFEEFDRLYDLNKESINKTREWMHVDLCAINHKPKQRQVRFSEIKRYDLGAKSTEIVQDEQLFVLGFVCHAVETLGEKLFRKNIYKVQTELIAFVPKKDFYSFKPKEYTIKFII